MKNQQIEKSFDKVAPLWPLQNFVACNTLQGFDNLSFDKALLEASKMFQQKEISPKLQEINLHTIKWLQHYLDVKQSAIKMPGYESGMFKALKDLIIYDKKLHKNDKKLINFIENISSDPEIAIKECLLRLKIENEEQEQQITDALIATLPGFASHIKYRRDWDYGGDFSQSQVDFCEYIATRLLICCLVIDDKTELLEFAGGDAKHDLQDKLTQIYSNEEKYQKELLSKLKETLPKFKYRSTAIGEYFSSKAQMVFCIDVRSHNIRQAIEKQGNYKTFGFAGFFGLPIAVHEHEGEESVASCPVLLRPSHVIKDAPNCKSHDHDLLEKNEKGRRNLNFFSSFYRSLKYNFTTPFALAEAFGLWSGAWMSFKTFAPKFSSNLTSSLKQFIKPSIKTLQKIDHEEGLSDEKFAAKIGISIEEQCAYALSALKMMGLVKNFAKIIILCGHGAKTENNKYASSLDCGACGGRHGGGNAKVLAKILNQKHVRDFLKENGIEIPEEALFIAALHNTTTDEVDIYRDQVYSKEHGQIISEIEDDLKKARDLCGSFSDKKHKSCSWAQTRPEWGLAKNASFIIGSRLLSEDFEHGTRVFLHSYDNKIDKDGKYLEAILTAPMIVTHWINSQYLLSTFDNVAYGSGSKITQNISGKSAVMQGNGSDLMSGLPMQSVFENDNTPYHEVARLNVVVESSTQIIDEIIAKHEMLQKLFKNQWIILFAIDSSDGKIMKLDPKLNWTKV